MPFLILTRAGLDDLVSRVDPSGAAIHLPSGIASEEELTLLRGAGAAIHLLEPRADAQALEEAVRTSMNDTDPLWVERAAVAAEPVGAEIEREDPAPHRERSEDGLRRRLAKGAGAFASAALRRLRDEGGGRHLMLVPYLGLGNATKIWVKGRVLDEHGFREQSGGDSRWSNLVALYRRLESDEVAGARVRAHFQGQSYDAVTDDGGYFAFEIATHQALAGGWHEVDLELPDSAGDSGQPVRAKAEVKVADQQARFGIISDIDDTVLWTNVTNKLNMALMLMKSNAHTRKPFKGVAAFYRALNKGPSGNEDNPVFYVSSSPWHLFGPLVEFLRVQGIPVGPLLLRELGMREVFKLTSHGNHKLAKIELILSFYPDMRFVLIGDSGEQDPEIYAEVVRRHPKSVKAIYIRNVNPDPSRIEAIDKLIDEVSATGTQLILAPDSVFAASHAAAEGLIHVDCLSSVRSDKKEDDIVKPAP